MMMMMIVLIIVIVIISMIIIIIAEIKQYSLTLAMNSYGKKLFFIFGFKSFLLERICETKINFFFNL
jgi:hypothetical protein